MADGLEVSSPSIAVAPTRDRYWMIQFEKAEFDFDSKVPSIHFGYIPDQIVFLASGEIPYKIAYGNIKVKNADFDFVTIRKAIPSSDGAIIPVVECGAQLTLAGSGKLQAAPASVPNQNKKILLWIILIAVIGLVGSMAYKLSRDLKKN